MHKTLTEILGIERPIIQAPMAGAQGSEMAIAVASAGGLGSLPCAMLSLEKMQQELQQIRSETDRPVNVNFFCHTPPTADELRQQSWTALLQPYYQQFGLDIRQQAEGGGRAAFNADMAAALVPFKPEVVSFHFGLPTPELLHQVKSWGAKVLSSATTVAEAKWLAENGADIIIAQGLEAGGHRGHFLSDDLTRQMGLWALLPQIITAVDVPVIAAGGIASAQSVAAAIALGAAGVQVGTAYLLCHESRISSLHRQALSGEDAQHTALTNLFSGRPARGIVNRFMRENGPINPSVPDFPLATSAVTPLRAAAEKQGISDFSPLWAGQNVSGCKAVSAAQLTQELSAAILS